MLPQTFWRQIEGAVLDGKVRVGHLLRAQRDGLFAAEPVEPGAFEGARNLAVRFIQGPPEPVLQRYLEASFLVHPNLVRCFTAGTFEFAGTQFVYAVLERAEVTLADIIGENPLTPEEAKELGLQLIAALSYLHEGNLVYGNLDPATVVRVGNEWKLSEYSQLRIAGRGYAGETRRMLAISAGTPPEAWDGIVSPAWDAWSLAWLLGGAVSERRTRSRDTAGTRMPARRPLPEPFAGIISECLNANPAERCSLATIEKQLRGGAVEPAPIQQPAKPGVAPEAVTQGRQVTPKERRRSLTTKQALATTAAFLAGFAVVSLLAWRFNGSRAVPVQTVAARPANGEADRAVVPPVEMHDPGLLGTLQKWTHASRTRNVDEQVSYYAPIVDTFYGAHHVSRAFIRRQRSQALSKVGDVERFDIDNVKVQKNGPDTSTVTFDKSWAFGGRSHYSGKVREQMIMRRIGGQWRITSERDLRVYPRGKPVAAVTEQS